MENIKYTILIKRKTNKKNLGCYVEVQWLVQ